MILEVAGKVGKLETGFGYFWPFVVGFQWYLKAFETLWMILEASDIFLIILNASGNIRKF